jgi:RNA polymerase sigma-70 factor (ECF subfamily)
LVAGVNGDPHQAALTRETRRAIWQAVDRLSTEQRQVIALRYLGELSYEEIAFTLDVSPGTIKSRLFYAHQALGKMLSPAVGLLTQEVQA